MKLCNANLFLQCLFELVDVDLNAEHVFLKHSG